jgi:hypothetical protein
MPFVRIYPKVQQWLQQLRRPDDVVAELLIEQTLAMLDSAQDSTPEARHIKREFRVEKEHVFCSTCN